MFLTEAAMSPHRLAAPQELATPLSEAFRARRVDSLGAASSRKELRDHASLLCSDTLLIVSRKNLVHVGATFRALSLRRIAILLLSHLVDYSVFHLLALLAAHAVSDNFEVYHFVFINQLPITVRVYLDFETFLKYYKNKN